MSLVAYSKIMTELANKNKTIYFPKVYQPAVNRQSRPLSVRPKIFARGTFLVFYRAWQEKTNSKLENGYYDDEDYYFPPVLHSVEKEKHAFAACLFTRRLANCEILTLKFCITK